MKPMLKSFASLAAVLLLAVLVTGLMLMANELVTQVAAVGGSALLAVPHIIVLKGSPMVKEGVASGAITPGHLIEFGGANDLQVHAGAGLNARKAFADVADLIGKSIDEDYASGDQVKYVVANAGDEVYALVAAGAAAITKGAALESAGDGTLRAQVASAATAENARDSVVAYALEAVDNSAGVDPARIRVEVA